MLTVSSLRGAGSVRLPGGCQGWIERAGASPGTVRTWAVLDTLAILLPPDLKVSTGEKLELSCSDKITPSFLYLIK